MSFLAPAKVNLSLHVTGQRDDGYHLLDALVSFADIGDVLEFTPADDLAITVSGRFAAGVPTDGSNILWKLAEKADWRGHIALEKNLPHAAGLGGGSADAGAFARWLAEQGYEVDDATLLNLGADVPVCHFGNAARMRGIGEIIEPAKLPPLPALE